MFKRSSVRTCSVAAILAAAAFTQSVSAQPLPTDDQVISGTLPNGMKYLVKKHQNPPHRANMWIHISSGSFNETDEQRGLAHYLEHMAFNGSENFPPGSVIKFFESMGLTFGQHQNAFTSFDQTTYQLAFPDTKPETLDKGMTFFADVAGRLLLTPAEIDEERQVIIEEKRARSGGQQRIQDQILERIAPGSLLGKRLPIGTEESLLSVQEKNFRDYYSKYYVPSNMTVMVVADEDPALIVEHIKKNFGKGENVPAPADQDAGIKPTSETFAIVATDKEITNASIALSRIDAPRPPATTYEGMRAELVDGLGSACFNRRIGAKINKGGTSYLSASASSSNVFRAMKWTSISADGKPEQWKSMLTEVAGDLQQARAYGFSQRELDDVKKAMLASAEQFVQQEKTLPARAVIQRMNSSVADGEPILSAQQQLDALNKLLPTISSEEISREFAKTYDMTNVVFVAELPTTAPGVPSEAELVTMGKQALSVTPSKPVEEDRPTELMAKAPTAGTIGDEVDHGASGVTTAVLSNGVTVHYRNMDIRKDQAMVSITLAAGSIMESAKDRGIAEVAGLAWSRPATSKLSSTAIRDLMTGKKANAGGSAQTDTMTLAVSGDPKELETGMQLAYLLLTDPKIEQAAFDQWKEVTLQGIKERDTNPQAAFGAMLTQNLYPTGEARVQQLTADQVNALKLEDAQKWLNNAIATAPIEVAIVGDIKKEDAMKLAATYLGSLASRPKISNTTLDNLRAIKRPVGPIVADRKFDTSTPVALACVGFYGPDPENISEMRTMQAASRIMSTRMTDRVREKEQLAYSPGAAFRPNSEYPGFSAFMAVITTDPKKVDRVLELVPQMFAEFAKDGPTAEEMEKFKKQIANTLDEQMKQPPFWVQSTGTLAYRNRTLDDVMAASDFYQNLTADQIKTVFAKYCTPQNSIQLSMRPAQATGAEKPLEASKPGDNKNVKENK